MIEMTKERLAAEAVRLSNDDVLIEAFNIARQNTLNSLAVVDATNTAAVIRLQQRVMALNEIQSELEGMVLSVPVLMPAPH